MTPKEEQQQLVEPMELIGKAMNRLDYLFKETNYIVYETTTQRLSERLTHLQNHDKYLESCELP